MAIIHEVKILLKIPFKLNLKICEKYKFTKNHVIHENNIAYAAPSVPYKGMNKTFKTIFKVVPIAIPFRFRSFLSLILQKLLLRLMPNLQMLNQLERGIILTCEK